MTDELRAAAERHLYEIVIGPIDDAMDEFKASDRKEWLEEAGWQNVSIRWIDTEHPADDDGDKPWNLTWLLSIGGRRDGCWIHIECEKCTLAFLPEMPHAGEVKIENEYGSGPWVSCETRRQVRDLLRVLKGGE